MSEQENVRTIEEIYAAFRRGDLPFLLNKLAEDVDWWHPRPAEIPWGGNRCGRESVAQFLAVIVEHLEVQQFDPWQFVARDDEVIVLGFERMRAKNTGRVYEVDWVHSWRVRGGEIVGFREYTDTATIVEALAQRWKRGL